MAAIKHLPWGKFTPKHTNWGICLAASICLLRDVRTAQKKKRVLLYLGNTISLPAPRTVSPSGGPRRPGVVGAGRQTGGAGAMDPMDPPFGPPPLGDRHSPPPLIGRGPT